MLNLGTQIMNPFINIWEKSMLNRYGGKDPEHSPIFIIGAPRTGSTVLYQTITNNFDVSYIDNLACMFHRNLFFGMWLSNKLFRNKPHNCFKSIHGNTWKTGGFHAPSECGQFWYRWLPKERHFIDYDEITDFVVRKIRKNIFAIINYFDKPFIFKNMNVGQRLRLIHEIDPDSKLIWVKRDPIGTCLSILKVKNDLYHDINKWWSIKPKSYKDIKDLKPFKQVVLQVYNIEKQINKDLKLFNYNNVSIVHYEDFRQNPDEAIRALKVEAAKRSISKNVKLEEQASGSINSFYKKEIEREVNLLDWDDYKS